MRKESRSHALTVEKQLYGDAIDAEHRGYRINALTAGSKDHEVGLWLM